MLSFKREFAFDDAIRLFEILSTHHLELTGYAVTCTCITPLT